MKAVLIFLTLFTFTLSVYFTYDRYERQGVSTLRIFDGTNEQTLSTKGKIEFNDAETAVERMDPTAFLRYRSNDLKLKIESAKGQIIYELTDDGRKLNINDSNGKRVLASTIKAILETGYDARGRAERLYKKGGAAAVMAATANMQQAFVKATYLDYLISIDSLSQQEVLNVIKLTGTIDADFEKAKLLRALSSRLHDSTITIAYLDIVATIDADYEKGSVLKNVAKRIADSTGFMAILKTTAGIESDHEKSQVIGQLVSQQPLTNDRAIALLGVIKGMGADFEKSNLLRAISTTLITDSLTAHAYLQAVTSMQSDYEKVRALEPLVKQPMSMPVFHEVALITGNLDAEHEKVGLLRMMLDRTNDVDERISRILMVIHDMNGEFEKVNLMKRIAERQSLPERDWVALIAEAAEVSNDSEKSNLLIHFAGRMPKTEAVVSSYTRAAKTINSDMEYGRALKASEK